MNCPYCDSEMEKGYVHGKRGIFWSKDEKKLFFFPNETKGDVFLWNNMNFYRVYNDNSYLCRNCGKVIIDISAPPAGEDY